MTSPTPDPVPPTPENPAFSAAPSQGAPSTHPGTTTPPGRPPRDPHPSYEPSQSGDHTPPSRPVQGHRTQGHPTHGRPVGRGERRAWNTASAVVGGVGALALLLGGAGTATALALTQEHNGSWTAPSEVTSIRLAADDASVYIHTSATTDRVQVQWSESGMNLPVGEPSPAVHDGALSLDLGSPTGGWSRGVTSDRHVSVTVPEDSPPVSLDLHGTTNSLSVAGTFKDVVATTGTGSVEATDVEASVVDARSTGGRVLLDGVHVSNRLDAHTDSGMALVDTQGSSPKRTSVTAGTGFYGLAMPTADYWYPRGSQQDFPDWHHPVTVDPAGPESPDSSDTEYYGTYGPSPLPTEISAPSLLATAGPSGSATPRATSSATSSQIPHATSPAENEPGNGHTADTVCRTAPSGRPCLYLQGTPMSVEDSGWMNAWQDGWRSPGARQDRDEQPEQGTSVSEPPAREN